MTLRRWRRRLALESSVRLPNCRVPCSRDRALRAQFAREEIDDGVRPFVQQAKAIAEYRRGNYAGARDWLQKSIPGMNGDMDWMKCSQATNLLFLTMAAHQLGDSEQPRQWLAEADRLIDTLPKPYNNTDRLITDIVRREALALIEGNPK